MKLSTYFSQTYVHKRFFAEGSDSFKRNPNRVATVKGLSAVCGEWRPFKSSQRQLTVTWREAQKALHV